MFADALLKLPKATSGSFGSALLRTYTAVSGIRTVRSKHALWGLDGASSRAAP
jgi:hypothetical protein